MRKPTKKQQEKLNPQPVSGSALSTCCSGKPRPTPEQIQARAYEIFVASGKIPGRELDNWLQAERELS